MSDESKAVDPSSLTTGLTQEQVATINKFGDHSDKATYALFAKEWARNLRDFALNTTRPLTIDQLLLPGYDGRTIIVAGAGASLKDQVEPLRRRGSTLIAASSAVPFLLEHEVCPDVVKVADSNTSLREVLRGYENDLKNIPFVLPTMAPQIWRDYPIGGGYYYFSAVVYAEGHVPQDSFENQLMVGVTGVGSYIMQGGCVTNASIGLCAFFALKRTVAQILLCGVDYSSPENLRENHLPVFPRARGPGFVDGEAATARNDYIEWPGKKPTRLVRYTDMIYGSLTIQLTRDLPIPIYVTHEDSILWDFIPHKTLYSVSAERVEETRYEPILRPDHKERDNALARFLQVANPLLENLTKRSASKAEVTPTAG